MPLTIPTRREVAKAGQAYVRAALPELDPTITTRRGYIGGMVKSLASALHDWYVALKRYADREPFPQTATGQFLLNGWWADITQLERKGAAASKGKVVLVGVAGTIVPRGEVFEGARANYVVDASVSITTQTLRAASLTCSGSLATFSTSEPHMLASGMTVTISGAAQAEYNGSVEITVTSDNSFTFAVAGSPTTPATNASGQAIRVYGVWAVADVTADVTGAATDVDAGQVLGVVAAGVSSATVTFGGIGGGADIESLDSYRARVIEALGVDYGMFSAAEIRVVGKQIPGVTRVWVREAQLYVVGQPVPDVLEGQVKIAFVRDDDASIFPSSQEVAAFKAYLLETIKPAHVAAEDVMVMSPDCKAIDFTFTSLSPDTASMRLAITASLAQFFRERVDYGAAIVSDSYRCVIQDAFDSERRQGVTSFQLSSPMGDIAVGVNELPVLGVIRWPT